MAHTPATRRTLIGALAGLGAAGALYGCTSTSAHAASPDAELLTLLAEFEELQILTNGYWEQGRGADAFTGPRFIEDDDERDAIIGPLCDRSIAMLDRICELYPTTPEGWRAVARCMLLFDSMLREAVQYTDDPGSGVIERLQVILLSGLTGEAVTHLAAIGVPEDYPVTQTPWEVAEPPAIVAKPARDPADPTGGSGPPWRETHPLWVGGTPEPSAWAEQALADLPLIRLCIASQAKPYAEIEEGFRTDPGAMTKTSEALMEVTGRYEKLVSLIRGEAMRYGVASYRTGVRAL